MRQAPPRCRRQRVRDRPAIAGRRSPPSRRALVRLAADRRHRRLGAEGDRRLRRRRLGLALCDRRLDQPRAGARAGRPRLRPRATAPTSPTSAARARSRSAASPPPPSRSTALAARCRCGLSFVLPMLAAVIAGARLGRRSPACSRSRPAPTRSSARCCCRSSASGCCTGRVQSEALLRQPMTNTATLPESLEIPDPTKLPLLSGDAATPLHIGLPIALVIAVVVGRRCSTQRAGPAAARGRPEPGRRHAAPACRIAPTIVLALFLAGALGGLAGALMLQGEQYSLKARLLLGLRLRRPRRRPAGARLGAPA